MTHASPILQFMLLLVGLSGGRVGEAQPVHGFSSARVDAALTRLLGDNRMFSAEAVLTIRDHANQEILSTQMGFSVRDETVCLEADVSRLSNRKLPAGFARSLREVGMGWGGL